MAKFQLLGEFPAPSVNQSYTHQWTQFGWVARTYRKPKQWLKRFPLSHWNQFIKKGVVDVNRHFTRWAGMYWKNDLTADQRAAWQAAGENAVWENYHGHPNYRGGFELFMITQRLINYMIFNPYQENAGISEGYQDTVPDPFTPPASPTILSSEQYDDGSWYFELGNCPDIHTWVIAAVVSQRRVGGANTRARSYITAFSSTWAWEPDICWVGVFLEYPFLPTANAKVSRVKIGLRWFNFLTLQFSRITWLAL